MKKTTASLIAAIALGTIPPAFAAESSQSVQGPAEEVAAVEVNEGMMLYGSNGRRVASVYRVDREGNPQVIIDGRLITVPASTLSDVDGKLTTSLSKRDISRTR